MPLDKWQKVVDINLTGAFLFAQAAGRDMLTRQWGRIINIASIAGMHASVQRPALRAATPRRKAGLIGPDPRARRVVGAARASASTPSRPDSFTRASPTARLR